MSEPRRETRPALATEVELAEPGATDSGAGPVAGILVREALVRKGEDKSYARVELTAHGVSIVGNRSVLGIGRGEIAAAWIAGAEGDEELVLALMDRSQIALAFRLDDMRRALELLGFSATERAMQMRLGTTTAWLYGSVGFLAGLGALSTLAVVAPLHGVVAAVGIVAGGVLSAVGGARLAKRPVVSIGADGIEVEEAGQRRFLPYERVAAVTSDRAGLEVTMTDGSVVKVRVYLALHERTAIAERIAEARSAYAAAAGAPELHAAFARDGRSIAEWRTAVARVIDSLSVPYRSRPIQLDDVRALVKDSDAPLEIRIGAALALASRGGPGLDEIAAIVASTADEIARKAFDVVARGRLDEIVLEELLRMRKTS